MKVFVFDNNKCNGCYGCQLACKDEHVGNDWRPISAPQPDTGHFWCKVNEITHGQVPKVTVEYWPTFCNHCTHPPCIEAMPDEIYQRDDGLVIIDPLKAKGKRNLIDACPYGTIFWNDDLEVAQKCTGCAHLVDEGMLPHCVDLCATGALRFGEKEEFEAELEGAEVLADEAHGAHVYYLNLPKLFISGDVWDPVPNEIIEGATVLLKTPAKKIIETKTDKLGDFWFRGLEAGDYQLTIEAPGYFQVTRDIELTQSLNVGDFPLEVDEVARAMMPAVYNISGKQ